MPLMRIGACVLASLAFFACGSTRPADTEPMPQDACKSRVVENAVVPGVAPAKRIRNPRPSPFACFTGKGMEGFARRIACDSGYALASLINIREPGFFSGVCYQADLEFYRSDSGMQVSPTPVRKLDSIPARGFQAAAILDVGPVIRGPQAHSGLVSDKGDTAGTETGGFGIALRYYFFDYLGFEAETIGRFASANAPGTKSMDFTKAWISRLGISVIPWQALTLAGRLQAVVDGGLNYSRLAIAKEYRDFVETHASFQVNDGVASGLGWYTGASFRTISRLGFFGDIGGRLEADYPKFPGLPEAFSGRILAFRIGLGYAF